MAEFCGSNIFVNRVCPIFGGDPNRLKMVNMEYDDEPTWFNRTAGIMDKFRLIPRLIMLAYIYAFYSSTTWFMALSDPTNAQAAFISTIVGAGAAFFGLYVGKAGASLPRRKK